MKSSKKVNVQIEDYKGDMLVITGHKSLKENIHGNWIGYVGRKRVENFSCAFDAATWFLLTEEEQDVKAFMTKHKMY